jgi:glutathione S-transferase
MLYLVLSRLPLSFRTVNLKTSVQKRPEYLAINRWGVVPSLRHRGLTILQSNVMLDYVARETGHFDRRTERVRHQQLASSRGLGRAPQGDAGLCAAL